MPIHDVRFIDGTNKSVVVVEGFFSESGVGFRYRCKFVIVVGVDTKVKGRGCGGVCMVTTMTNIVGEVLIQRILGWNNSARYFPFLGYHN